MPNETQFADHLLSTPPPKPGDAVAWGVRDEKTGMIPIFRDTGLWFVVGPDGREIKRHRFPEYVDPEPDPEEYRKFLHDLADRAVTNSLCYFIGAEEGPIKIGHSVDVGARLKAFQMGCPVILRVMATAPGGVEREVAYHNQFAACRAHGEWFERTPELLAEIEALQSSACLIVPPMFS